MLGLTRLLLVCGLAIGLAGVVALPECAARAQDKPNNGKEKGKDGKEEEGDAEVVDADETDPNKVSITPTMAADDRVVVSLGRGDAKALMKGIEDALSSESSAKIRAGLEVARKLGRAADVKAAQKLLDHKDWEVAELAFRLLLSSNDKTHAKIAFGFWDKHEKGPSDRVAECREAMLEMNVSPDHVKELLERAKATRFPEAQQKRALELLREFLDSGDDATLEDIDVSLKKGAAKDLLKGASTANPTKVGAVPLFFPDAMSKQKKSLCAGNLWLVKGSNIKMETASMMRTSTKEGWDIRFKAYIPTEEDEIQVTIEHKDMGAITVFLGGKTRVLGSDRTGGSFPMANAGKWVEFVYVWVGETRGAAGGPSGANAYFTVGGAKIGNEKSPHFTHGNDSPTITVKGSKGNVFVSPGEISKATKLP